MSKYIIIIIAVLMTILTALPLFRHQELTEREKVWSTCLCRKCSSETNKLSTVSKLTEFLDKTQTNEWEQGEFVTLRRVYPHQRCGGHLVFNGKATPAPYSEKEFFYTHVCDLCGATNQILNATWPQFKQEWRSL